jgi:hypothetical protein
MQTMPLKREMGNEGWNCADLRQFMATLKSLIPPPAKLALLSSRRPQPCGERPPRQHVKTGIQYGLRL